MRWVERTKSLLATFFAAAAGLAAGFFGLSVAASYINMIKKGKEKSFMRVCTFATLFDGESRRRFLM